MVYLSIHSISQRFFSISETYFGTSYSELFVYWPLLFFIYHQLKDLQIQDTHYTTYKILYDTANTIIIIINSFI